MIRVSECPLVNLVIHQGLLICVEELMPVFTMEGSATLFDRELNSHTSDNSSSQVTNVGKSACSVLKNVYKKRAWSAIGFLSLKSVTFI